METTASSVSRSAPTSGRIPRLRGLPLVGNLFELRYRRLALQKRVQAECGDIGEVRLGPVPVLALGSAELAESLLVEHADAFKKSRGLNVFARPLLGDGLLTSEHERHRRQRKLIAPAFSHRRIARYAEVMAECSERAIRALPEGEVDVAAAMMQLTLAIVGKTLFDSDVGGEAAEIGAAFTIANRYVIDEVTRFVHLPLAWPTARNRRLRAALARLDATIYRLVAERRASGRDVGDVLSTLIAATDETDGARMTDEEVRDEAMTLFLAGHETTANALAWTHHLLGQHPSAYARLREEVDRVLGGRTVRFEDLPSLPWTLQVLKESMRLYPPAYVLGREAEREVQIGPYRIPRGAFVMVNIYGIHRRADYFPDPERFDPSRFEPAAEKALPKFAYMPFGGGPRICVGNHFALMEGQIALATIAQRVAFEAIPGVRVEPEPLLTLRPRGGIAMRARRRATSDGR